MLVVLFVIITIVSSLSLYDGVGLYANNSIFIAVWVICPTGYTPENMVLLKVNSPVVKGLNSINLFLIYRLSNVCYVIYVPGNFYCQGGKSRGDTVNNLIFCL